MKIAVTTLAFCVAALLALGLVMLYSSSMMMVDQRTHALVGANVLYRQLIWCGLGLVACGVAATLDYRWLKKFAWVFYALALILLVAVLAAPEVKGARRWFKLGAFSVQPSEFAKLALLLALAWYGDRYQRHMATWWRGIVIPGVIVGGALGLIFIEPDRGTTILLGAVSGCVLLVAGVRWAYLVPPAVAVVAGLVLSILQDPMRLRRIASWLDLEETKSGTGYQAYQAMLALGAGGWTGLGLGNGRQKLGFVPEHTTDFIFSMIGEELGLIASLLVLLAYLIIVICGVYIASRARDKFGFLLGIGITFLIGLQALINIGVVTSALPNKGLALPFISYGGSSLMVMLAGVGVLLNISRQARAAEVMVDNPFRAEPASQPA